MNLNSLYTFILLVGFPFTIFSQSCITNVDLETACIDAFNFSASLTFDHTLEANELVNIEDLNGNDYGLYDPNQQPILLDVLVPNALLHEASFIIIRKDNASCSAQSPIVSVFCNGCEIETNVISTDCIEDTNQYQLKLEVIKNGTTQSSEFYVKHTASQEQFGPFTGDPNSQTQFIELTLPFNRKGEFTIFDATGLCHAVITASNDCAPIIPCSISNIDFQTECLDTDNVLALIEFDYEGLPGDKVVIIDQHGQNYGQFQADQQPLGVEVALAHQVSNVLSFTLRNPQDTTCSTTSEQKTVSCYSCDLDATFTSAVCTPGADTYRLTLEIQSVGASVIDDFIITHNATGRFIGMFNNYAPQRSRTVAMTLSTDLQGDFTISDSNLTCEQTINVQVDCSVPLCYISNIEFETECIDANNYRASIGFDYEAEIIEMVSVRDVHGNDYGNFDAAQQPLNVEVSLQDTDSREFGFILTSIQDLACIGESDLQTIECFDCALEATTISADCIPGDLQYQLTLEVNNTGSSSMEDYTLTHTATGQFIGLFNNYNPNTPRTISVTLPTDLQGSFTISDASGVCETTTTAQVDCSIPFCYITNVNFETECINANNFVANIEFDYETEFSGTVNIKDMNGNDYGLFDAAQQPINVDVVLQDTDSRAVGFVVTYSGNDECSAISALQTIDCIDCELTAKVMHHECENSGATYHVAINLTNNGDTQGAKYLVTHAATGQFIGLYSHFGSSNTRHIDFYNPINLQGDFNFTLEGTNCSTTLNIEVDCTPVDPCLLSNAAVQYKCLDDGQYEVSLTYEYSGLDTVRIRDTRGNLLGLFDVNDQPVVLTIDDTNLTNNGFVASIKNANDENCFVKTKALPIDCIIDEPCVLEAIDIVSTNCNDDETYNLTITYSLNNSDDEFVRVSVNGGGAELYNNNGLITIENVDGSDNSDYDTIEICSNNETDCCKMIEFLIPDCNTELRCSITNIEVTNIECSSNEEYEMFLDFEFEGEEELAFTCMVNGEVMMIANTASLPIKMTGMLSSGNSVMEELTICLNDVVEDCCAMYTFQKPNCLTNSVVDNSLLDGVTISPNPARDMIYVNDIPQDIIGLTIVDNLGRTIKQIESLKDVGLDVSNFQNGLYTIQFFTNDNRVMNRRFIKI